MNDPRKPNRKRRRAAKRVKPNGTDEDGQFVVPGPTLVFFPVGAAASVGGHPSIAEPILEIRFELPGAGAAICRLPLPAWAQIREAVDATVASVSEDVETEARAAHAGIHLPSGVDVDAEAKAHQQIRGDT